MEKTKKTLIVAFALITVGSVLACMLQSNFGRTQVKDIALMTEEHQYLHAIAFVPKGASKDNKVPCVITSHGWLNSAEVQDAASIELSRRGIMVIAMDAYGHGFSSSLKRSILRDSADSGQGMIPLVEYVTSGIIDYIDTNRIGVMGHSMGGIASSNTVNYYSALYDRAIEEAQSPDSDGGTAITAAEQAYADSQMKVKAALPTGMPPSTTADWSKVRCNMGYLYGLLEEGGSSTSTGTADLRGASREALDMVRSVDASVTSVEEGKFYGDKNNGTLRVLYQPYITHPLIHFDPVSTRDVITYFTYVFDVNPGFGPNNQIFMLKEICNFIAMIGLFMLLVPFCQLLLACPVFADLKGKEGPKIPAPDANGKKRFWIGWALGGVMSFIFAVIATVLPIPNHGFGMTNWTFFAAPTMNVVAIWTGLSAIWSFFWFFFNYKKDKAAGIRNDSMIGIKISGKAFGKTLALSASVIGMIYVVVWFFKWALETDFRFWTPAIKTFDVQHLFYFIQYLPIFFAFYFANSLMVNGASRFENVNEKKNLFILGLGNILGCGAIWALQYGKLLITGTVFFTGLAWISVLVIAFCFWQLFLAPFFLRKFYKLTGTNWAGALIVSSIYVLAGIMNTAVHSTIL